MGGWGQIEFYDGGRHGGSYTLRSVWRWDKAKCLPKQFSNVEVMIWVERVIKLSVEVESKGIPFFKSGFPAVLAWVTHTDESKKDRGWLHWRSGRFSAFDSLARQRKLTSVCSQGVQLARYGPSQVPNMNQINGWEQLRERGMGTMMCLSPSSAKVRARQKQICSSGWAENKPGGQKQINNRIWTRRKTRLKSSPTIFQADHRSRSFWMISLQILLVDLEVVDGCEHHQCCVEAAVRTT